MKKGKSKYHEALISLKRSAPETDEKEHIELLLELCDRALPIKLKRVRSTLKYYIDTCPFCHRQVWYAGKFCKDCGHALVERSSSHE